MTKRTKKLIVNGLTFSRIIGALLVPLFLNFLGIKSIIVFLIFLFLTDFFDGKLARKWNVKTRGGSLLDPLCDKVLAFSCLLSLLGNEILLLLPLFLEFIITVVNIDRTLHEEIVKSNIFGKIKTWILSITLVLVAINKLNSDIFSELALYFFEFEINFIITKEIIKYFVLLTIVSQIIAIISYIKESINNKEKRSSKVPSLKSLKEICKRLFDEEKFNDDKDKPLILLLKK